MATFLSASFELLRKEQHKSFQEKQKLNLDKNKGDFDISTLREDSKEEKRSSKRSSDSDELVIPLGSDNDSEKSSVPSQTPASRPLVPPGFKSTILDKSLGAKPINHSNAAEVTYASGSFLVIDLSFCFKHLIDKY